MRGYSTASPTALRSASSRSDRTRISSPSRKESSPKSSSPVCATARATSSSWVGMPTAQARSSALVERSSMPGAAWPSHV